VIEDSDSSIFGILCRCASYPDSHGSQLRWRSAFHHTKLVGALKMSAEEVLEEAQAEVLEPWW